MHCFVIGTDHELQTADSTDRGLCEKITAIALSCDVVLVAEELDPNGNVDTFGRQLSRKMIGENRWLSIDMADGLRKDAGIYVDLQPSSRYAPGLWDGRFFPACRYFRRADGIRENFWLDRIEEKCDELRIIEGTIVITCGHIHRHYLCEKAMGRGHSVTVREYLPYDFAERYGELIVCD
jgi:hypothetical protein